jgi:hypothetical protein
MTAPKEIQVNGRTFTVTSREGEDGRPVYELHGKRGACYFTMRTAKRPEFMFLCNARGFGLAAGMERVWLTDADGVLKEH